MDTFDQFCAAIKQYYGHAPNADLAAIWYQDYTLQWDANRKPLHEYVAELHLEDYDRLSQWASCA